VVCLVFAACSAARAEEGPPAVYARAMAWLVAHQNENGSFGQIPGLPPGEVGITALVVKGLAEAPPAAATGARPAVARAVAWLLAQQKEDGSFSVDGGGLGTYRTSMTISALAAVDRAAHREAIARAKDYLMGTQFDETKGVSADNAHYGGWGYDKAGEKPDADLSNVHFVLQALKDAGVSPESPAYQRALAFVTRCQNNSETNPGVGGLRPKDDGGFIYDPGMSRNKSQLTENEDGTRSFDSYASMTYAGLLSLAAAEVDAEDPRVQAALGWIRAHYTLEENYGLGTRSDPAGGQQGLYYYYYIFAKTLDALDVEVVETVDGERHPWGQELLEALAARQREDGSFVNELNPRWWEQDPVLVTGYVLGAMNHALRHRGEGE
jgi:squalene-hopene/tetraprenyl-beta-curcumene cyclase